MPAAATAARTGKVNSGLKLCLYCGADISARARKAFMCPPCAAQKELIDRRAYALKRHIERVRATRAKRRYKGIEYEYQYNSPDGLSYIITNNSERPHRVKKVCCGCERDDEDVRGWWGPIFSAFDERGKESAPVLLCLSCYKLACEGKSEKVETA